MSANRTVACPICGKEIEVRSNFAHQTLVYHIKTMHKESVVSE